ncbi:MAG: 50S ribosomal protein L28 [Kiritimatiellia bacterium]
MARACEICGKTVIRGKRIVRRGLAKKKGGIGLHTTGVTPRDFRPNLQRIRVRENGRVIRRTVCAACIKAGRVTKA